MASERGRAQTRRTEWTILSAEFKSVCQTMVMDVGVTNCKYGSRTTAAAAGRPEASNKQRVIHNFIILTLSFYILWEQLAYIPVDQKKTRRKNPVK